MDRKRYDKVVAVESGIYRVAKDGKVKYVAVCDYGRQPRIDRKTGKVAIKPVKTEKTFPTLKEAREARAEAVKARSIGANTSGIRGRKFRDAVEDFKRSGRYREMDKSYQAHFDNHFNHMSDFFGEMEVDKITVIDMENYYEFQLRHGNRMPGRNREGGAERQGICVNTLMKHKSSAKALWDFMMEAKVYGVAENVAERSKVPKATIIIDGKAKKVSRVPYNARSLTWDELNYTLNDAVQNEFDRSVAVMIGLGAIGALRHSEIAALQVGKVRHDEYMDISPDIWKYSGFDEKYYREHDELMMIDTAVMENRVKLPKAGIVHVAAVPDPLKEILDYAMEQRAELYGLTGRKLESRELVYMPLINLIKGEPLNSQKISRKWKEYQKRRNKRMEAAGLEPIPVVRLHDLRHTFSNLLKRHVVECERSYNMGHKVNGENTTDTVYINDRFPERDGIIRQFNENIRIDWGKALHKKLGEKGGRAYVNGSGHLVISDREAEERKKQGRKFIFREEELEELLRG